MKGRRRRTFKPAIDPFSREAGGPRQPAEGHYPTMLGRITAMPAGNPYIANAPMAFRDSFAITRS
jgi:hypothetical protein